MALYNQRIGDNAAAEQPYQQALKLAPGNGSVLNNYGAFLCSLGQYVPAQQQRAEQFSAAALGRQIMARLPTVWKTQVTVFLKPGRMMKLVSY